LAFEVLDFLAYRTKSTIITNTKPGFHEKSDGVTQVSGQVITEKTPDISAEKPLKIIPMAAKEILNTGVHKNKKTTSKINKSVFGFIPQITIKLFFVFKLCEERWVPFTKKIQLLLRYSAKLNANALNLDSPIK